MKSATQQLREVLFANSCDANVEWFQGSIKLWCVELSHIFRFVFLKINSAKITYHQIGSINHNQ